MTKTCPNTTTIWWSSDPGSRDSPQPPARHKPASRWYSLEKTGKLGGSSAMSGGFFAFSGTEEQAAEGVQDSAEIFLQDLLSTGGGVNDRALLDAYLDRQDETYHWLKDQGANFRALEISSGQSAPRSHNTVMAELLAKLHRTFTENGGETQLNHRAVRLVRGTEGSVTGVVVESGGDRGPVYRTRRRHPRDRRLQPQHGTAAHVCAGTARGHPLRRGGQYRRRPQDGLETRGRSGGHGLHHRHLRLPPGNRRGVP